MEKIAWTPSERLAEFHKAAFKLIITSAVMFLLALIALVSSSESILSKGNFLTTITVFFVSIGFSLFGLYYLRRSFEQRQLGNSLLLQRESSIANESRLLIAEIEVELKNETSGNES